MYSRWEWDDICCIREYNSRNDDEKTIKLSFQTSMTSAIRGTGEKIQFLVKRLNEIKNIAWGTRIIDKAVETVRNEAETGDGLK